MGLGAGRLIGLSSWIGDLDLSSLGLLSRIAPLLFMGALIGDAAERLDRADEQRIRLAIAQVRHRQAVQLNDSLIQGMASAKWALESGRHESALATLEEMIATGQQMLSAGFRAGDAATATPQSRHPWTRVQGCSSTD